MNGLVLLATTALEIANPCPEGVREASDLAHPSSEAELGAQIQFYVERLGDTSYVAFRPLEDLCVEWYEAAEQLAVIGAPALPALMRLLVESDDPYEVTQVLYALRLAGQDHRIRVGLGVDVPQHPAAFPEPRTHEALREAWVAWWKAHGPQIEEIRTARLQVMPEE
jgi:hypothetical protein